jgi:hypothetical protein
VEEVGFFGCCGAFNKTPGENPVELHTGVVETLPEGIDNGGGRSGRNVGDESVMVKPFHP